MKVRLMNAPLSDFPEIEEGSMRGIFEKFQIIRLHINITKEDDTTLVMTIKW